MIIYLHADPVTGSKLEVSQTGQQSIYLGSDEVFEPLGQKIRTTPPFQEPPPPNPPPILNDSKSPEWQCTLYSMMGFTEAKELPANCSIAAAERSIWERSPISPKQKGNPSKINPVDSPIPGDGPYSAGGQTLAYALGAAKKRGPSDDGEDDSKKPVSEIGRFDAGTIYASDTAEAVAPELDSSFKDASQSFESNASQTGSVPLKPDKEKKLQDSLKSLENLTLSYKCKKNVIDKLSAAFSDFSWTAFLSFLAKGGTFYDGPKSKVSVANSVYTPAAANARFKSGALVSDVFKVDSRATQQVNALTSMISPTLTVYFRSDEIPRNVKDRVALVFHEALHGFGGSLGGTSFFDDELQKAFVGAKSKRVGEASKNIDDWIRKNCL